MHRGKRFNPFNLGQDVLVFDDVFIGGQQDIELPAAELRHKPTTQSRGALICGRHKDMFKLKVNKKLKIRTSLMYKKKDRMSHLVSNFDHRGCPFIKFIHPVRQGPKTAIKEVRNISN